MHPHAVAHIWNPEDNTESISIEMASVTGLEPTGLARVTSQPAGSTPSLHLPSTGAVSPHPPH